MEIELQRFEFFFEGLNLRQVAWHNPLFVNIIITVVLVVIGPVDFINYTDVPGINFDGNDRLYEDLESDSNPEY